jgi:hypothetical protein
VWGAKFRVARSGAGAVEMNLSAFHCYIKRLILAHGFGGFSPGSFGPVALGPVARQHFTVGAHGETARLAVGKQMREKKGCFPQSPSRAHP